MDSAYEQQVVEPTETITEFHSSTSSVLRNSRPAVESDDSGDVPEDERSDDETCREVPKVIVSTRRAPTRRAHHHRHRPLSHHDAIDSSDSDSTVDSPVTRKVRVSSEHCSPVINSRGCSSESSGPSSVPQSPSSAHQTDESSSPRRTPSHSNKWSPSSLKNVLRSLSLNALLLPDSRTTKTKSKQKILRSPVSYTYVKGLSGLPTQRVPLRQCGGRPCYPPTCLYPPTAELCCLQRAAAIRALCLDR